MYYILVLTFVFMLMFVVLQQDGPESCRIRKSSRFLAIAFEQEKVQEEIRMTLLLKFR